MRFNTAHFTRLRQTSDHEGELLKFCCLPRSVILSQFVPTTAFSCAGKETKKYAVLICVSCTSADQCHVTYTSVTCDIQESYRMLRLAFRSYVFLTGVLHITYRSLTCHKIIQGMCDPPHHISLSGSSNLC